MYLEFEVPGNPQGKGRLRHRVVRSKACPQGYASGYTPAKTLQYESSISLEVRKAWRNQPILCPLFMHLIAYFPIPKSFSKKKRSAAICGALRPITKPDLDNVVKACCDAINKIVWKDDAQVVDALIQKFYSEQPRIRIMISDTVEESPNVIKYCAQNRQHFSDCKPPSPTPQKEIYSSQSMD